MSGLGRKEFNAGDILLASEVQGYLQDQAVMVFDDATARGSAIPSPSEGMVTYDKATDTLEFFDGSSFVPVVPTPPAPTGGGLEHINTSSFTTVSSVALPTNTFSSTYKNYLITLQFTAASATSTMLLRLRSGSTNETAAAYQSALTTTRVSGAQLSINSQNATSGRIGDFNSAAPYPALQLTIFNPQTSGRQTNWSGTGSYRDGTSNYFGVFGGVLDNTTSYDSLAVLIGSGNFSGFISAFGYKD
jgi:hypothetical protein